MKSEVDTIREEILSFVKEVYEPNVNDYLDHLISAVQKETIKSIKAPKVRCACGHAHLIGGFGRPIRKCSNPSCHCVVFRNKKLIQ